MASDTNPGLLKRQLCELVIRCSRALNLAYFDSAEESDVLGAHARHLNRRLQEDGGMGAVEWTAFTRLWAQSSSVTDERVSEPMIITEPSGDVYTWVRRDSEGFFQNSRVGVFRCTQMLMGKVLPPAILADWYRQDLRRRYHLTDSPEFLAFSRAWLKRFNNLRVRSVTRRELIDATSPHWSQALLEALEYLHVLGFHNQRPAAYARIMDASEANVAAEMLGMSTSSLGLDFLLQGAMRIPPERQTVLITGAAGFGKSTLALGIAAQAAARGGVAVFFRFEVDQQATLRQLNQFYGHMLPFFQVDAESQTVFGPIMPPDITGPGLLAIRRLPAASAKDFLDGCTATLKSLRDDARERLIVFDSLSAIDQGQPSLSRRAQFHLLTSTLRSLGFTIVCVMEQNASEPASVETFVADLAIHVGQERVLQNALSPRTLEIVKSRHQPCHRGLHRYALTNDCGLDVTPSAVALLSTLADQGDRHYFSRQPIRIDVENFAELFTPSNAEVPRNGLVPFWMTGSTTALFGPRGLLKTAFARTFCRTMSNDVRRFEPSLLIHFADMDRQTKFSVPRRDRMSHVRYGLGYSLRDRVHDETDAGSYVLEFLPGYLAPEQVLWTIREILDDFMRRQMPIRRAAISDLANLEAGFRVIHRDTGFLPAVVETLAADRVTTALVYSTSERTIRQTWAEKSDPVFEQVQALSENVIRFASVWDTSRERVSIRVERSADASHDRGVYELRRQQHNRLTVLPTFDSYVSVVDGKPRAIDIQLYLQAETALQEGYCAGVQSALQENSCATVTYKNEAAWTGFTRLSLKTGDKPVSFIVALDNWELPLTNSDAGAVAPLASLKGLNLRFDAMLPDLIRCPVRARGKRKVFTVPHFLNPSFLMLRRDFYDFLSHRNPIIALGMGQYRWADLLAEVAAFQAREGSSGRTNIFRLDRGSQGLTCLFLEVLSSLMTTDLNKTRLARSLVQQASSGIGDVGGNVAEAIKILRRLLPPESEDDQGTESLMERVWYSAYRSSEQKGVAIRLPGSKWTCGDWHVGILENGFSPRPGLEIICNEIVDPVRPFRVWEAGVGLPPFRSLYSLPFAPRFDELGLAWFREYIDGKGVLYRSMMSDFPRVLPLLETYLRSLLIADLKEQDIGGAVEGAFTSLIPLTQIVAQVHDSE